MSRTTRGILLLTIVCVATTAMTGYWLGWVDSAKLQTTLLHAGLWAPILYILFYVLATACLLPSTPLNLTGGVLFGLGFGMLWTGIGAILAAIVLFTFTRSVGHDLVAQRMAGRLQNMNAEIRRGGKFYMFAVRLLPLIPNGLINYGSGLTSISFRDYVIGSVPGTVLGILPPVLIGSSGIKALRTGQLLPLVGAMALKGLFVAGATWYRRNRETAAVTQVCGD
jgi:uncharacterized membrane protein YdjX (TVP38/TMEM64 family)